MAEPTEKPPEAKPDPKPDPKPEPKPEDRRREPEPRQEPESAECPDCGALVRPARLGTHRFSAHAIERRATKEPGDDDDKEPEKRKPPAKRKPDTSTTHEKGTQKPEPATGKGRWGKVRSGWG
jgi:hypothetical protein